MFWLKAFGSKVVFEMEGGCANMTCGYVFLVAESFSIVILVAEISLVCMHEVNVIKITFGPPSLPLSH